MMYKKWLQGMKNIVLLNSFNSIRVNAILQEVICLYEKAFPGQIVAYYIQGSYADETFVGTSDLDLCIVFRDRFPNSDLHKVAEHLWESYPHSSTMELDIGIVDEESLRNGVHPTLKLGSKLLYGEDVTRHYPIMSIEAWARERMHAAHWLLVHIYERPDRRDLPLTYPDPTAEFYGYTNRTVCLPDGEVVPSTRNLIRTTGWAATALLALQARQYVVRKRDCHRLYRHSIGDEWSALLEDIYSYCRQEWHYLIPTETHHRQRLRAICEQTLGFERHFLALYQNHQRIQQNVAGL